MSAREQYDISPKEREVLEWRAARRAKIRAQYLKEIYHPTNPTFFDEGIQRFMSVRATCNEYFRPTASNFFSSIGFVVGLTAVMYWWVKSGREKQEHLYRTGQVAYADRSFKFS